MNKMLLLYLMNIRVAIRTCFTCIVLDSVVIYSATIRYEALFKTTGACDTKEQATDWANHTGGSRKHRQGFLHKRIRIF